MPPKIIKFYLLFFIKFCVIQELISHKNKIIYNLYSTLTIEKKNSYCSKNCLPFLELEFIMFFSPNIIYKQNKKCPYLSFSSMTTFSTFIAVVIFCCCIVFFITFNFLITSSQITGTTNEGFEATHNNWLACSSAWDVDRVNGSTQLLVYTDCYYVAEAQKTFGKMHRSASFLVRLAHLMAFLSAR